MSNLLFANVELVRQSRKVSKAACGGAGANLRPTGLQSHFTNSTSLQYCGNEYPQNERPEYPDAPVPYNSYYYLKRTKLEAKIIEEIGQSGALIRIKAPNKWGKTSLLLTILEACQQRSGYQIMDI